MTATTDKSGATTDGAAAGDGETAARSEAAASGAAGADAGDGTAADAGISHDDCFDLLSNHRRRYALHHLQRNSDETTLGELADRVAAWENDVETDDVTRDQRKRVYTSLQQVHLPRMDELGVVEFDGDKGVIRPGPAADDLDVYLELVGENDVPWSTLYLALALLDAGLIGAATLGVAPLAGIPPIGWVMFILTTFLVTSVAHQYFAHTRMLLGRGEEPPGKQP